LRGREDKCSDDNPEVGSPEMERTEAGPRKQTTMDGKRIVILLLVFASSGGSARSE
jgi:hypothetical protein